MKNDLEEFELFEKMYFHEIDMRNDFSQRINIPIAIVIALVGSMALLFQSFSVSGNQFHNFLFAFAYSFAIIFLLIAIYKIKTALAGHTYLFVAKANDWYKLLQDLRSFYEQTQGDVSLSLSDLKYGLMEKYVSCATVNAAVNDERSRCLYDCNNALLKCAVAILATFLVFEACGLGKAGKQIEAKVQIVKELK